MWVQQRLKGLPGLLSSSWARRLVALLGFLLVAYWYLGGGGGHWPRLLPWPRGQPSGGPAGLCLQAETRPWVAMAQQGEARLLQGAGWAWPAGSARANAKPPPALVGNGHLVLDVAANRLWVAPGGRGPGAGAAPALATEYGPLAQIRPTDHGATELGAAVALLKEGALRTVRCLQAAPAGPAEGPSAGCVTVREEILAHRGRPHLYLQRLSVGNPTGRLVAFDVPGLAVSPAGGPASSDKFVTSLEKAGDRQFYLSSGRVLQPPGGGGGDTAVLVVVAAKKVVSRVQVAPKSQFEETLLSVVHTSEPVEAARLDETLARLREAAKKEMLEVMRMRTEDLVQEHRQAWADLFISGVEMRRITDAHTPSSETINATLYYVLSATPAPLLDPLLGREERDRLEATLNYADHCFSGHATMHAENLWPGRLASVPQVLQLSSLWRLTLEKRGCRGLVAAGAHGLMQGMVLSFGGLQFTENHLQFQSDPEVLQNGYSLRGIRYRRDLISLAVRLDAEGKPFLHVSVKAQAEPPPAARLYACEGGCANDPVELTAEPQGHAFPVMVTQPITPLLYISTDLVHLQDLRHTLHLKAILAHEEHMAKRDPGLPFLFWFSVASLVTLFHLFLCKLIYNEYCGPSAKPLFRSKV